MKIAIASDIYYPMINGVAVFSHNLADGLARAGHEVLVLCPSFSGEYHEEVDDITGVRTVYLKSKRFPLYPDQIEEVPDKREVLGLKMPRLVYKTGIWFAWNPYDTIEETLHEFQPDVIHLQTAETIALAIMRYARKNDTPLVSTGHAYPDNITGQFKMLKPVKRPVDAALRTYMASFLKHAEYATMPTEIAIDDLVPQRRRRFKVTVEPLSNGIDLSKFKAGKPDAKILKKYGLDPKAPRVLYVGRVDPEKSIGNVLAAFRQVAEAVPAAELTIVGDGIARAGLEKQAAELGLSERVRFAGKILPPDLYDIYRAGTVFATASETETQGIVLIEAAASGLPIVAVDAGAVSEICQDGVNGALCQPGDVDGFAAGLIGTLNDPARQKRYAKASLKIAKQHDIRRTLARFVEIYKTAIAMKKAEK